MKKIFILTLLTAVVSVRAQTESGKVETVASPLFINPRNIVYVIAGRIAVDNTATSPVPVYLITPPENADSIATTFWQGVGVGFAWGGIAWIFRLVRQTAKQNPEI